MRLNKLGYVLVFPPGQIQQMARGCLATGVYRYFTNFIFVSDAILEAVAAG
jgi:hypothetical protein